MATRSLTERPHDNPLIRVLVVEDHEILAKGVSRLLDSCSDIEVVGVVGTVSDAVATAVSLRPDVVLMDYQLRRRRRRDGGSPYQAGNSDF